MNVIFAVFLETRTSPVIGIDVIGVESFLSQRAHGCLLRQKKRFEWVGCEVCLAWNRFHEKKTGMCVFYVVFGINFHSFNCYFTQCYSVLKTQSRRTLETELVLP